MKSETIEQRTLTDGRTIQLAIGNNGKTFVTKESVEAIFHNTIGNEKVGNKVGTYNVAIEYTCTHACECYKNKTCYACNGCYNFPSNQADYTENYKYFITSTSEEFIANVCKVIEDNKLTLYRYFTCGDIINGRFFECMVEIARRNPSVRFWAYTKKYHIVNAYCDNNGLSAIPENLVIIFSHWLNNDGTYFPMNNKYNFPTSEFIPIGQEELAKTVTHICPCSDQTVNATCATCEHACYTLKHGQSMALLEHSTSATRERDKTIKQAKKALKNSKKQ